MRPWSPKPSIVADSGVRRRRRCSATACCATRSRRRGRVRFGVTDEASAIEAAGHRPLLVTGSSGNFKVTTADDLAMMDVLLQARTSR